MTDVVTVDDPVVLIIETAGARGPTGIQGPAGTAPVYVQDTAPTSPPAQYMWVQTNYLTPGNFTMWIQM